MITQTPTNPIKDPAFSQRSGVISSIHPSQSLEKPQRFPQPLPKLCPNDWVVVWESHNKS
jgi:hypothetical protein